MAIGIFQSLIIVNILTTNEFGLIGLVTSIAGIAGIAQHLGLASSSTKEISSAKNDTEIFHIALTSISIRYLISVPVALGLILSAPFIAQNYGNLGLVMPLQIFGLVLLVQAFQSIFNSVIAGTQKFKVLFSYQILITFLSLMIYLPLVFYYKSIGYFYALLIFNIFQTLILGYLAFKDLKFKLTLPSKSDYYRMFKDLLSISLTIYFVKILITAWQELPVIILSRDFSLEMVGIFAFAFNFSSKLMSISDSITDVNLPVFSKKASESMKDFFDIFVKNFNLVYAFIFFVGMSISFWSKEILQSLDFLISVGSSLLKIGSSSSIFMKYKDSIILFYPLLLSIIFYSYLNIFKSSIFIPLKILRRMIFSFVILLASSFGVYFLYWEKTLISMSFALALGSILSFLYSIYFINKNYDQVIVKKMNIILSIFSLTLGALVYYDLALITKVTIYLLYVAIIFYIFKLDIKKFIFLKLKKFPVTQ